MSHVAMSDVELREFLSQPLIADIVTLKKDGSPHITPVDYYFDGTYLYFSTTTDRAKGRNIKRDNRIAVSIRNENAHKVVLFAGTADILDDRDQVLVRRIVARYTSPDKVDELLSGLEANRIILRMKPTKTISWDYTKSGN
ncbi:MAG: PPOX class F420-dependent oxidoreductase [Candidatus Bathyarchaeia archaeon]|jgi:PPOX class probable F420-dependent enzyme